MRMMASSAIAPRVSQSGSTHVLVVCVGWLVVVVVVVVLVDSVLAPPPPLGAGVLFCASAAAGTIVKLMTISSVLIIVDGLKDFMRNILLSLSVLRRCRRCRAPLPSGKGGGPFRGIFSRVSRLYARPALKSISQPRQLTDALALWQKFLSAALVKKLR